MDGKETRVVVVKLYIFCPTVYEITSTVLEGLALFCALLQLCSAIIFQVGSAKNDVGCPN